MTDFTMEKLSKEFMYKIYRFGVMDLWDVLNTICKEIDSKDLIKIFGTSSVSEIIMSYSPFEIMQKIDPNFNAGMFDNLVNKKSCSTCRNEKGWCSPKYCEETGYKSWKPKYNTDKLSDDEIRQLSNCCTNSELNKNAVKNKVVCDCDKCKYSYECPSWVKKTAIKNGCKGFILEEKFVCLDESDFIELRDRFGKFVEFIVRDMVFGRGERWKTGQN